MERTMRLADYVERGLADVVAAFERPDVDGALAAAMRAALGLTEEPIAVRTTEPVYIAAGSALVSVSWSYVDPTGLEHQGCASLQMLVIQSGSEPMTELLVTMAVDQERATEVATVAHRLLDDLTRYLAALPV